MSRLGSATAPVELSSKKARERLEAAQERLLRLRLLLGGQIGQQRIGPPLCAVFEGWDASKIRCAAAHLDPVRDPDATARLMRMIDELLPPSISEWTEAVLDAALRVSELNLSSPFRQQRRQLLSSEQAQQLVDRFGTRRPDLPSRITVLVDPNPTGSAGESEGR